jgi:hypothetical protein
VNFKKREKMGKLTDKQWVSLTEKTVEFAHKGLRLGQSYMNALFVVDDKIYNKITGTESDCFYDDNKIINFINYLNK